MRTNRVLRLILVAGAALAPSASLATPAELSALLGERAQALREQIASITPIDRSVRPAARRTENRQRRQALLTCLTQIERASRDSIAASREGQTLDEILTLTATNGQLCRRSTIRARAIVAGLTRPQALNPEALSATGSGNARRIREAGAAVDQALQAPPAPGPVAHADEGPDSQDEAGNSTPPVVQTVEPQAPVPEVPALITDTRETRAPRSEWPASAAEVAAVLNRERIPFSTPGNASLTQEEMTELFPGFEIAYQGSPRYRATLYGRIPALCRSAFEVQNSSQQLEGRRLTGTAADGSTVVGFRVLDPTGAGRACIRAIKGEGPLRCETAEFNESGRLNPRFCGSLRDLAGASDVDFSAVPSAKVGLIYTNPDSDRTRDAGIALVTTDHVSRAEDAARRAADAQARRRDQIERLAGVARGCNGESAERRMSAITSLARMNRAEVRSFVPGFNPSSWLNDIARAGLDELIRRIARADIDELEGIRERLLAHLQNYPQDSVRVRSGYEKIVNRYATLARNNPEGLELARAAIDELAETGAYEGAALERLQNVSFGLQMASLQRQASQPNAMYNMGLWNTWQQLYQQTYQAAFKCQYGGSMMSFNFMGGSWNTGSTPSLEGCATAAERFQGINMIPQYAAQAQQQRQRTQYEMQMRMQQAMASSMGGLGGSPFGQQQPGGAFAGGNFGAPMPLSNGGNLAPSFTL